MQKIPALFKREQRNSPKDQTKYAPELNFSCAWVFARGVVATRKWDGTAVRVLDGKLWARFDAKHGKQPPEGFVPAQDPDPVTGHWPGWVPAQRPEDKWIREAFTSFGSWPNVPVDGTYEACGPKINSNREQLTSHILIPHGQEKVPGINLRAFVKTFIGTPQFLQAFSIGDLITLRNHPCSVVGLLREDHVLLCDYIPNRSIPMILDHLREVLQPQDIEGVVFHGPDGQMAKCTKSGLGLQRR